MQASVETKFMQKSPDEFSSIYELMDYFSSEQVCLNYLTEKRWGGEISCPHCSYKKIYSFSDSKRFKCAACRKQFTAMVGTIFEDSKIPLKKWFVAIHVVISHRKGISSHQLARDLKVTQKTAWFMLHRVRWAIKQGSFEKPLEGVIEIDETFVGGKNKNRHKDKKVEKCQGRSFKDKTPVLGMMERAESTIVTRPHKVIPEKTVEEKIVTKESKLYCKVVADTKQNTIQPIVQEKITEGATVYTDEWWAYRDLNNFYNHSIVNHAAKQYVNGDAYTNNMEGFWSQFKRSIIGIYHNVSKKHLHRYVDEAVFRHNKKNITDFCRTADVLTNIEGSLKYKNLIHEEKAK